MFLAVFIFLDDDLEKFIEEVLKVNAHGLSPLRNASIESNWSFGHALFFASTVITTIGTTQLTLITTTIYNAIYIFIRLWSRNTPDRFGKTVLHILRHHWNTVNVGFANGCRQTIIDTKRMAASTD